MFYANEIRQVAEYGQSDGAELKPQEKKLATQLIESLSAPFDVSKYRDEYQAGLQALIEAKLKGQQITEAPHPKLAPVIDLMEALKKSLAEKTAPPMKPPVRAVPAPAAATEPAALPAQKKARRKSVG
jgi:DNA end-binding protein Ku